MKYYKKHKKEIDKLIAEEDILFEIASRSKLTGGGCYCGVEQGN